MSKGSGRRRISPADGIKYDEETMTTNIEDRGGKSFEGVGTDLTHGRRTGAQPTATKDYGSHGGGGDNGRYSGVGRKNDYRNWKSHTRGKQYDHNIGDEIENRPVPEGLARRMREKSINADIRHGFSCAEWSKERGIVRMDDVKPFDPDHLS